MLSWQAKTEATVTIDNPNTALATGRVLILLDGSRLSLAALEAAAEIAAERNAEVLGVFVEELNLLRAAEYAFTREVGGSSGLARPLELAALQSRMQAQAERARQLLQRTMARHGLVQTLQLCRGRVAEEVISLMQPEDLVVLGRVGWTCIPGARLGSTAQALVQQAPGEVLLWTEPRAQRESRVVVLLNHHQLNNYRALQVGIALARRSNQAMTVLVRSQPDDDQSPVDDVLAYLQNKGVAARVERIAMANAGAAVRAIQKENASQLVVSRSSGLFANHEAEALLAELNLPVTVTP